MNFLIKNWSPKIVTLSLASNFTMNYYKYNVDGLVEAPMIIKGCTDNKHIFTIPSRKYGSDFNVLLETLIPSVLLGGLSIPFVAYDFYDNKQQIKKYENGELSDSGCFCEKL